MNFELGGKFEIVFYNNENYYRLEFNDESHTWYKRKHTGDGIMLVQITDGETRHLLEGVWFNDVKKGKYDDVVDEHKSPVEKAYKDWWGQYPELETDSKYDDTRWKGFKAGFHFAYEEKVKEDDYCDEVETHKSQPRMNLEDTVEGEVVSYNDEIYYRLEYPTAVIWYKRKGNIAVNASGVKLVCIIDLETHRLLEGVWFNDVKHGKYDDVVDEPEHYDEVEWDEEDNPKPVDEVINMMVEERNSKKLWNILKDKWGFSKDACGDIVEAVAEWLPKEQSAAGSQNTFVECNVEGYNDCLREMKEMLR
jgi:hypothetical protein